MTGLLRRRAERAVEEMDRPDCDPRRLERTYAQFALVNRAVSGWRSIYRTYLRPALSASSVTTVLDIGCGGGDVAIMLARWAAHDGRRLEVLAIDPDDRAYRFAAGRPRIQGVAFRQASTRVLVDEGRTFDVVISNHVIHHLTPPQFQLFLNDSALLCHGIALHNDIRRSTAAYALFAAGSWPLRGSYIRVDGLTSIRRSYTTEELIAAAPPGWQVRRHSPFRNLLTLDKRVPRA